MLLRRILVNIFFLILIFNSSGSKEAGGVNLPDSLKQDSKTLILNGGAVFTKYFFNIYAIGLYLEKKSSDINSILNSDKSYIIRMHFLREVTREQLLESMNRGFRIATGGNTSGIKNEIAKLNSIFTEKFIRLNDILQFDYKPGTRTKIYLNNKLKTSIPGFPFKKALMGIWLGPDPKLETLRRNLVNN